jgi:hypothetical protein
MAKNRIFTDYFLQLLILKIFLVAKITDSTIILNFLLWAVVTYRDTIYSRT